jgi:hypothetical protein
LVNKGEITKNLLNYGFNAERGQGTLEVIGMLKPKIKMSELIVEMQWEVLKVSNLI